MKGNKRRLKTIIKKAANLHLQPFFDGYKSEYIK
jgi:hypothetical protein